MESVQANGMINGTTFTPNIFAGGAGVGNIRSVFQFITDPGTTFTVTQNSALTAGASTVQGQVIDQTG